MKVTDTQIQEFLDMFGDDLPNYEHEPRKFIHYWNIYMLEQRRKEWEQSSK